MRTTVYESKAKNSPTISDAFSHDTDRYNTSAFYHANSKDRSNILPTKGGHFIKEDPYAFDSSFFKFSAAEAAVLDPKQRILLEVTYEALENAGLPLPQVAGTRTACIIGTAWSDYRDAVVRDFEHWPRLYLSKSLSHVWILLSSFLQRHIMKQCEVKR